VLYRRVSTGPQVLGQSLDVQRTQGMALARARGWEIVGDYVDVGVSGALPVKQRPGLRQLLRDARTGMIDQVIVAAVDRLGRRTAVVLEVVDMLLAHDVVLHSLS
jgi:DNA invertase Pin-like site-specific DNA recombinase